MSEVPESPDPEVAEVATPTAAATPSRRSLGWRVWHGLWIPVVTLLLLVACVWGMAHTEWFTRQVVTVLPSVRVTAPQGALLGDFKAERIEVDLPRGGRLMLEAPAWRRLRLHFDVETAWHLGLWADSLTARRVVLNWVAAPAKQGPTTAPVDLGLPVSVHVARLQVAELQSNLLGTVPLKGLDAGVAFDDGLLPPRHRVRLHHLAWSGWTLKGQAQIAVRGAMVVDAALQATGALSPELQAQAEVKAKGHLADLSLTGQARLRQGQQPAQTVSLDAQVQPFAPWPVSRLKAVAQKLNLADLHVPLPQTALSGEVVIEPVAGKAGRADLQARIALRNDLAGAWDARLLPVRSAQGLLTVQGARTARTVDELLKSALVDLRVTLPTVTPRGAAHAHLSGGWGADRTLNLEVAGLEPQVLHGRAPALQLAGTVSVQPDALPSGQTRTWRQLQASLQASLRGAYGPGFAQPALARKMKGGQRPVAMTLKGHYAPGVLNVSRLSLASGEAQALLTDGRFTWSTGQVAASTGPTWQTQGQVAVESFDPQVWLPWPEGMSGRNQVSAQVGFKLDADWRGEVKADVARSVLAGVPLKGQLRWRSPQERRVMSLNLDMDAGGNLAKAQAELPWRMGATGAPQLEPAAQWQAQVNATALQTLQPLAPLLGARQLSGVVVLDTQGRGLWPQLISEGKASITRLNWRPQTGGPLTLASAQADWRVDMRTLTAPAHISLGVNQLQAGVFKLEQAQARLDGTGRTHQGQVQATFSRAPSAEVGAEEAGAQPPQRVHLNMVLQGGLQWQDAVRAWQGRVQELVVQLGDKAQRPLLQLQPTDVLWRQDQQAERVVVSPTRLNLMGAQLRLNKLNWHWADRRSDAVGAAEAQLDLEPFNLPALLASWQPQAGWGGDLMLTGQVTVQHSLKQPWVVDAAVTRQSGDISLSEPTIEGNSAQRLGIRDGRVTLQARNGVWTLNELFEGRLLGKLTGRQVVQAREPGRLPQGSDALSGNLDLTIGNLRPWGTWIPAGWRVSGQLQAKAELGGTLGAPQYRGQVQGQNLGVGQALLGVNLSEGQLQMALQGDQVILQQFEARGGSAGGRISAQGQASLGASPLAQVLIKAERFPLLQRVDRRVVISGEVQASLGAEDMRAEGRVLVDEGLIDISQSDAPTVGDDVTVINRPGGRTPDEASSSQADGKGRAPKRKLVAALDVDLGQKLRIKGRGLDARLVGALKVTTPANRPALQGTIRVANGTFAAYGQKLVIERGAIAFTGAVENPRLDILAMRAQSATAASSDVKVGVSITGTAQDPRVRLYSDPSMSETEKLSWLVLGRAPTGLGGADLGLLQTAAVALLSGEGSSPSDNLIGMLGLDELSVRQTDGTVRDTVVNVGKQVSRYWYLGYERNLNATGGNWQLIYRLARRFTLRLQAGVDNAADLIWSWRWD